MSLTDRVRHLLSIHYRHLHIRNDYVERLSLQRLQSFPAIRGHRHLIATDHLLQAAPQDKTQVLVVLYQ